MRPAQPTVNTHVTLPTLSDTFRRVSYRWFAALNDWIQAAERVQLPARYNAWPLRSRLQMMRSTTDSVESNVLYVLPVRAVAKTVIEYFGYIKPADRVGLDFMWIELSGPVWRHYDLLLSATTTTAADFAYQCIPTTDNLITYVSLVDVQATLRDFRKEKGLELVRVWHILPSSWTALELLFPNKPIVLAAVACSRSHQERALGYIQQAAELPRLEMHPDLHSAAVAVLFGSPPLLLPMMRILVNEAQVQDAFCRWRFHEVSYQHCEHSPNTLHWVGCCMLASMHRLNRSAKRTINTLKEETESSRWDTFVGVVSRASEVLKPKADNDLLAWFLGRQPEAEKKVSICETTNQKDLPPIPVPESGSFAPDLRTLLKDPGTPDFAIHRNCTVTLVHVEVNGVKQPLVYPFAKVQEIALSRHDGRTDPLIGHCANCSFAIDPSYVSCGHAAVALAASAWKRNIGYSGRTTCVLKQLVVQRKCCPTNSLDPTPLQAPTTWQASNSVIGLIWFPVTASYDCQGE